MISSSHLRSLLIFGRVNVVESFFITYKLGTYMGTIVGVSLVKFSIGRKF